MEASLLNASVGVGSILLILIWYFRRKPLPTPPGPTGYPIVGYLKTIPSPAWKTYHQWSQEYGSDIIGYRALGSQVIVLNSLRAVNDLLEKRSAIYSDRPVVGMTMVTELVGLGWSTAAAPYHGRYWRESRKLFQHALNPQASRQYRSLQAVSTQRFLQHLLETPEDFRKHIRYMVGTIIIRATYGIDAQRENDPYIAAAEHVVWIANQCMVPGRWLVDIIPILKYIPQWLPGASFKRQARSWKEHVDGALNDPFSTMKADDCLPEDCAGKHMLQHIYDSSEDIEYMENVVAKGALATMYLGGSDTTTSLLDTFFLAMVCNPDVRREAQKHIDLACGDRLPDFSDYDSIPYVHAIVRECLRWRTAVPLAFPHMVTQDDVYNGYFIPAGAIVFPNVKAILLDPGTYVDPEEFRPARFLKVDDASDSDVTLDPDVLDPSTIAFGFGRRACTGRWLAYDTLWITIASVLATLDIKPVRKEDEMPTIPRVEYKDGFFSYAGQFECSITPRSLRHQALITDAQRGV